jgi:hypothetical protein
MSCFTNLLLTLVSKISILILSNTIHMINNIICFVIGIYVAQEYPEYIPNVKATNC